MKQKVGIFLQARLGSVRLPGKALFKIQDKTIISHAMTALKKVDADIHALLTDDESYERFFSEAKKSDFKIFKGSAKDVLDRYISAADLFGVDTIVRATGDNPLVDAEAARLILESHFQKEADYSGFDSMPLGTGVEILQVNALKKAWQASSIDYDHEHVSPFLYKNPQQFVINRIMAPERFCYPEGRVTIDTKKDYLYMCKLFSDLYTGKPLGIQEIIPWLKNNR